MRQMNELLVTLTLGERDGDASTSRKWERAEDSLLLDNGDWTNPNKIVHHCGGLHCCKNGIRETRAKIWTAILVSRL